MKTTTKITDGHDRGHCQICNRNIGVRAGVIAHHGYERPGSGWQTGSCMGARFLPYELSCERIPAAVASVKLHMASLENRIALLAGEGKPTFTRWEREYNKATWRYDMVEKTYSWDAERAAKDEAECPGYVSSENRRYEDVRRYALAQARTEYAADADTLKALEARITKWKKVW